MKELKLIVGCIIGLALLFVFTREAPEPPLERACTLEAMICPDGSAVGRTGPNCEFTACPGASTTSRAESGIVGTVILGPVCPVLRDPPEDDCADKPFATELVAVAKDGRVVKSFASDSRGSFKVILPPGVYDIRDADEAKMLPRCGSREEIRVTEGAITQAPVFCDTGIR